MIGDGASGDQLNHLIVVKRSRRLVGDNATIPEGDHAVSQSQHFIEPMGNEHDPGPLSGDAAHRPEQNVHLVAMERGGRLVKYEHVLRFRPAVHGARDRHDRALCRREQRDRHGRIEVRAKARDETSYFIALFGGTDGGQAASAH